MRKLRSDSKWHGIPPKAQQEVARWLLEEGISYDEALKRAENTFGIKSSRSSIARFYKYLVEERALRGLNMPVASPDQLQSAVAQLLGAAAINSGVGHRDNPVIAKRFLALAKLMMRHEERELKEQWLELELQRLGLRNLAKK